MKQLQLVVRTGLEPATYGFQVRRPNHSATLPPLNKLFRPICFLPYFKYISFIFLNDEFEENLFKDKEPLIGKSLGVFRVIGVSGNRGKKYSVQVNQMQGIWYLFFLLVIRRF